MDPYVQLGVAKTATPHEVTGAYRRLAQRWHPDRNLNNPQASALFLDIQVAYRLLNDPVRRAQWDRQHEAPAEGNFQTARPGWADRLKPQWVLRPRPPGLPGDHAHVHVRLPLASVMRPQVCPLLFQVAHTCPRCLGHHAHCPVCGGTGQRFVTRRLALNIPAGVHEGQVLRAVGQGHDGPRFSQPGDLWVGISWSRAGRWRWRNDRLEARYRRSGTLRRQGGPMKICSPEGVWGVIQVPPLPTGAWVRVQGLGLPVAGGARAAVWVELV
jgi:DnaJ-class molecular chaperone